MSIKTSVLKKMIAASLLTNTLAFVPIFDNELFVQNANASSIFSAAESANIEFDGAKQGGGV